MGIIGDSSVDTAAAIGLVQGKVIDMVCASDVAEKAAGVESFDVKGLCPQHMTMIALVGDTSSVEAALNQIKIVLKEGNYSDYSQID